MKIAARLGLLDLLDLWGARQDRRLEQVWGKAPD